MTDLLAGKKSSEWREWDACHAVWCGVLVSEHYVTCRSRTIHGLPLPEHRATPPSQTWHPGYGPCQSRKESLRPATIGKWGIEKRLQFQRTRPSLLKKSLGAAIIVLRNSYEGELHAFRAVFRRHRFGAISYVTKKGFPKCLLAKRLLRALQL